jgi:hypothetical protein
MVTQPLKSVSDIMYLYPNIWEVMAKTCFQKELRAVIGQLQTTTAKQVYSELSQFRCRGLIGDILCDFEDWFSGEAKSLERDLKRLCEQWGVDDVQKAFASKLCNGDQYEDVLYEIAVGSVLSRIVRVDTLKAESPLQGSAKNTDFTAMAVSTCLRVEVKHIREKWPPSETQGDGPRAYTRSQMDPHEWEDFDNPEGVVTFADVPQKKGHQPIPESTKAWQAIEDKLAQCDPEVANIIVVAYPNVVRPDAAIKDALFGSCFMEVERNEDGRTGSSYLKRNSTAPFVEAKLSKDAGQFVEPFRVVSAVWDFRLRCNGDSIVHENPNASIALPRCFARRLSRTGQRRIRHKLK